MYFRGKDLSLSPYLTLQGTLISYFSFFMNIGRVSCRYLPLPPPPSPVNHHDTLSRMFFSIRVTHANGIARCVHSRMRCARQWILRHVSGLVFYT